MKIIARLISLIFIFICFHITFVHAAYKMPPKVKSLIDNLLLLENKDTIWSGYNPLAKPVALHVKGVGSYLVGAKTAPKDCFQVEGFSRPVYFFRNKAADNIRSDFSAFYHTAEAGNVFLYNYNTRDLLRAELLIVHETFHLFQHSVFKNASSHSSPLHKGKSFLSEYKYGFQLIWEWWKQFSFFEKVNTPLKLDINDISIAYVENKLLAQALLDKKNYKTLVGEFVRVRNYRRKKLSSRLLEYELKQEKVEGTAEYVCWKSLAEHFSPIIAENFHAGVLLSPQFLTPGIRYYSPGAVQGFLLDRLGVQWKIRVQNGEDIFSVMRESFPPDKNTRDVNTLLRELYSNWVKKALTVQVQLLEAKKERAMIRIKKYSDWRLVFYRNFECKGYSTTCYDEQIDLGDGNYYQENCHNELQCEGFNLSIDKPIIDNARKITILLGNQPRFKISIDDVKLSSVPITATFKKLYLKTEGITLNMSLKGSITINGKTISVKPFGKVSFEKRKR